MNKNIFKGCGKDDGGLTCREKYFNTYEREMKIYYCPKCKAKQEGYNYYDKDVKETKKHFNNKFEEVNKRLEECGL